MMWRLLMSVSGLGFRRISDSEYRRRGLEMPDGPFGQEGPAISDELQRRISIDFGVDPFDKVLRDREPAMLFADDVVDLAAKEGVILVNEAVFAESVGSDNGETPQLGRDIGLAHCARRWRARAFASRIKCSS